MASNYYSDFDVKPDSGEPQATSPALPVADEEPQASPTSMVSVVASETFIIGLTTALDRFLTTTLPHLTPEQLARLVSRIPVDALEAKEVQAYDAAFSIADELSLQIKAVQALRQHVFPGGRFKIDGSVKEAKEVLTTCNQMIKTLMDSHERVMNMERMRAIETATLDVLYDLEDSLKEKFLQRLELILAEIE